MTNDEVINKINSLNTDLFNVRFRKVNGHVENTAKISQNKNDVARLLTTLNTKK